MSVPIKTLGNIERLSLIVIHCLL